MCITMVVAHGGKWQRWQVSGHQVESELASRSGHLLVWKCHESRTHHAHVHCRGSCVVMLTTSPRVSQSLMCDMSTRPKPG
jgi:hypothetical protein